MKLCPACSASIQLDALALRNKNVILKILHLLKHVQIPMAYRERLFTVVTELYNNALDHGVLGMDSSMKRDSDGFIAYYALREQRLANLTEASIVIGIEHTPTNVGGRLSIQILDSGPGFDYLSIQHHIGNNMSLNGRGLAVVKRLCTDIRFLADGNRVHAYFEWCAEKKCESFSLNH